MRYVATAMAVALLLAGCGGSGGGGGKNDIAASACGTYAKAQLGDKAYQLDLKALAVSMKAEGDMQALAAPIVIEPGTSGEAKETLDCKVRFSPDGKTADVISLGFVF